MPTYAFFIVCYSIAAYLALLVVLNVRFSSAKITQKGNIFCVFMVFFFIAAPIAAKMQFGSVVTFEAQPMK